MNLPPISLLFAQAAAAVPVAASNLPWWREGWVMWLITLLTVAVPTLLAWVMAKSLRASDMWGRIATVLVALAAGCPEARAVRSRPRAAEARADSPCRAARIVPPPAAPAERRRMKDTRGWCATGANRNVLL